MSFRKNAAFIIEFLVIKNSFHVENKIIDKRK